MPIELVYFRGTAKENNIHLEWETATEINNKGFELQYLENKEWKKIGFVNGKGESYETQNYRFELSNFPSGNHLFRLKQIDFDGRFEVSEVVAVFIENNSGNDILNVYPNPTQNNIQIKLNLASDQQTRLEVRNAQGKQVAIIYDGFLIAAENEVFSFNLSEFSEGVYLIQVISEHFSRSYKVLKMN